MKDIVKNIFLIILGFILSIVGVIFMDILSYSMLTIIGGVIMAIGGINAFISGMILIIIGTSNLFNGIETPE